MTDTTINWFEIPVTDLARAARFYETVLETNLQDMDGPSGPMKSFLNAGTPAGALVSGSGSATSGTLIYFGTTDIAAALARAVTAGGELVLEKTSIGPFGHIGQFTDSEGNLMALHSD